MSTRSGYTRSRDQSSKADDKEMVNVILSGNHVRLKGYLANNATKGRFSALVKARSSSGSPLMVEIVKSAKKNRSNKEGFLECVRVLAFLDAPLDLQDKNGRTACHWAVVLEQVDMLSELVNLGAHVDIVDTDGLNPLHLAINRKSLQCVELLCGIIPSQMKDCLDLCGKCPLFRAICCQATEIVECLLFAGCDPNGYGDDGRLLTVHSIEKGCNEILLLLVKHGASVMSKEDDDFSICHLAACQENSACIAVLSECLPMDILNSKDQFGKTALMYATMMGLDKNVELLLKAKVDERAQDLDGKSALHYTSSNTHCGCTEMLCAYDEMLIELQDVEGKTALHDAVSADNTVVLNALLVAGAQPNVPDYKGHTGLHLAVAYGSLDCLLILLKLQVDINARDACGATALHYSTQLENNEELDKARLQALGLLLKVEANVEAVDAEGRKPLHWAVTTGNLIACQLIVDAGADPDSGTMKEHLTALHLACSQGWIDCVKFLVRSCKTDVNAVDYTGCSPLFYACATCQVEVVEYLLGHGADPNRKSKDGKTPVHCAAAMATASCLQLLISANANLEARNGRGESPLHEAASAGNLDCLDFLITSGCQLNVSSADAATPLHYAIAEGHKDIANALLRRGAHVNSVICTDDMNYATPLDVAIGNGDHDCISLLQCKGARTGHSIVQSAANRIQSFWRRYGGERRPSESRRPAPTSNINARSPPLVNGKTDAYDITGNVENVRESALAKNPPISRENILKQVEQGRRECQLMAKLRADSVELLEKYKITLQIHALFVMWDFTRPSDLQLLVNSTAVLVHRDVMVSASPVFKAMLESDFQEKDSAVIALPGKSVHQMQTFLNFVYPFGHRITDDTDVNSLLDLSREYQVQHVRDLCEIHLLTRPSSFDLLVLAQEFNLSRLLEKCVEHVASSPSVDIQKDPRFDCLSDKSKLSIVKHQLARMQQYNENIRTIVSAKDFRFVPHITAIKCGHKPRQSRNPHFICSGCKLAILKSFLVKIAT